MRLPVDSKPILVVLKRTYVCNMRCNQCACNIHSCVKCGVLVLHCVQSSMYVCMYGMCGMYGRFKGHCLVMLTPMNVYFNRSEFLFTYVLTAWDIVHPVSLD